MRAVSKWTRDDCYFTGGTGTPNPNASSLSQTAMRGWKAIEDTLRPIDIILKAPNRQNETVDTVLVTEYQTLRVSLKTATYKHKKPSGAYSGFHFQCSKAPRSEHCDAIIAVRFDINDSSRAISVIVFDDAREVYESGLKYINWHRTARLEDTYSLDPDSSGPDLFRSRVASMMIHDEDRV